MSAAQNMSRHDLEMAAAAALELKRRKQSRKTVYGFYRPNGEYGGELVRCLQEQGGQWVEVDAEPDVRLAAKLEPVLTIPKRFKVIMGGRGSSKSIGVGSICASRAKDYGEKTLCMREVQNTIEDSVHALLSSLINEHGWFDFDITDKHIQLKGEDVFKFRGISRNPDGVKSMFGFKYGWVEEAHGLSGKSLETLTPTLREAGSEHWFTINPGSSQDPVSERFITPFLSDILNHGYYEDDLHLIVRLNYTDNPWHRELEAERKDDETRLSKAAYEHKWLGMFNDDVPNALIVAEWFDAAVDAHLKLGFKGTGALVASYDPADEGPDDHGYCLRHGSIVLDVDANGQDDINDGCDWALGKASNGNADWFTWDCDGLGVGLKRQVADSLSGRKIEWVMFKGSETAEDPEIEYQDGGTGTGQRKTNRDTFYNRRAQYYVRLRDRFAATYRAVTKGEYINPDDLISLSSDMERLPQLRAEVCRIPLKSNGNGKIQIMSKEQMAKPPLSLPSPNLADALMMSMMNPPTRRAAKKIKFAGWA